MLRHPPTQNGGTVPDMSGPFSEDQEELRRYARQWLDEKAPFDEVRRIMETAEGFDADHWGNLADLGWLGIAVGEDWGGAGFGFGELAVLAEEMGRSLYPSPFLSTVVVGAWLIEQMGSDEQRRDLLPALVEGRRRLAAAAGDLATHDLTAQERHGTWSVSGEARYVLDGHTADTLIVEADTPAGARLFLVDPSSGGVARESLTVMDLTRPLADIRFSDAIAEPLGEPDRDVVAAATRRAIAALAMEQVAGAQACLEMSVAYAKERHQFGRPIGSFQAIKHLCADMLVAVESARSTAYHLAAAIDHDPEEAAVAAPLAKSFCSDAFVQAASDAIQIHGGIGFTWEHNAHLFLKRAKSSALMFGDGAYQRAQLAEQVGIA